MAKTKTFGRADDNDIKLSSQYISRHHARITMQDDSTFLVEDLDSRSGTFVNGHKIQSDIITLKDKVSMADTDIDLVAIFQIPGTSSAPKAKSDPNNFVEEFLLLKPVQEKYKAERREIIRAHQQKAKIVRAGWMIAPLPLYYVLKSVVSIDAYFPISVTISTLGVFLTGNTSPQDKLDKLDENHQHTFVCPKYSCSTYLGQQTWQSYYRQGKCHRCGAKYANATN